MPWPTSKTKHWVCCNPNLLLVQRTVFSSSSFRSYKLIIRWVQRIFHTWVTKRGDSIISFTLPSLLLYHQDLKPLRTVVGSFEKMSHYISLFTKLESGGVGYPLNIGPMRNRLSRDNKVGDNALPSKLQDPPTVSCFYAETLADGCQEGPTIWAEEEPTKRQMRRLYLRIIPRTK